MDQFDKFIKSVAWKFPKGYPDMNNPKDKAMLFELAENFMGEVIVNEAQVNYNVRIYKALGLKEGDKIPTCNTPLKLGEDFNLGGEDEEIWKKLYPILPLKKDSDFPTQKNQQSTAPTKSSSALITAYASCTTFASNENGKSPVTNRFISNGALLLLRAPSDTHPCSTTTALLECQSINV